MSKGLFRVLIPFFFVGLTYVAADFDGTDKTVVRDNERSYRIFHFVLRGITEEKAYWMAVEAKKAGFNTIQITLTDGLQLDNSPWAPREDAWSKGQFRKFVLRVKAMGIDVVPELKLLTHQEKFFQNQYPGLMFNKATYDPTNDGTYIKVFALLDEVIALVGPKALHIGHDEVAGHNEKSRLKKLNSGDTILPATLYLQDILKLHNFLEKRGIEAWMWGDMLISSDEFPSMGAKSLHGQTYGYGKKLRDALPRSIVIVDWHYSDRQAEFHSVAVLIDEGFRVIGATWKNRKTLRNFSRYASENGADGMMATTWYHVQRKEWDVVEGIIGSSGRVFLDDFPDR